ncbi:hypothetical protein RCL1_005730 [Eukaryota sp. TZLM3-RCL]
MQLKLLAAALQFLLKLKYLHWGTEVTSVTLVGFVSVVDHKSVTFQDSTGSISCQAKSLDLFPSTLLSSATLPILVKLTGLPKFQHDTPVFVFSDFEVVKTLNAELSHFFEARIPTLELQEQYKLAKSKGRI